MEWVTIFVPIIVEDEPKTQNYYYCRDFKKIYFWLNTAAVIQHIVNAIGVGIAYEEHLKHIKTGYLFVSPTIQLQWTNNVLVHVECSDVNNTWNFIVHVGHTSHSTWILLTSLRRQRHINRIGSALVGDTVHIQQCSFC